jgi:hypothetical protein
MEHFEEMVIASADHKLRLWLRYVDDMFSIWPHKDDKLISFLQHLNTQRSSIKLTIKNENYHSLMFS